MGCQLEWLLVSWMSDEGCYEMPGWDVRLHMYWLIPWVLGAWAVLELLQEDAP